MAKRAVESTQAPRPIGPYSQAVVSGGFVFASGQIGLDPATGALVPGGVAAETHQAFANLTAVLDAAGSSLDRVVRVGIYLAEMTDFATVNEIYGRYFRAPFPARATVAVRGLPRDARVEIDLIAET